MAESTPILGAAIGKPELKYQQFPYADALKAMVGGGLPEEVAQSYVDMSRAFNEGRIKSTQKRTEQNVGTTTLETFAKTVFAPALRQ